ncbi:GDP-L-fucose synthase [bacterium]|nr:GDP-L-fucose synthase [bacterium]
MLHQPVLNRQSSIFVAGHKGLVGSAIVRKLKAEGHTQILVRDRSELDLSDQKAVHQFFKETPVDFVFLAAAKVGGIYANQTYPADFLYENLILECNVLHAAAQAKVQKLLFLGSSCIYPRMAPQPIVEESLLTSALEPTNEPYAIAKIAGLKLCQAYQKQYGKNFISAMPTNLYGPGDSFHPENSHVIPGMMRRFHEAKVKNSQSVTIWGSGQPRREFLHVDDLAEALYLIMAQDKNPDITNVGTGEDGTIRDLAEIMKKVVGFEGSIELDPTKPDGTPRKVLNVDRIKGLGWKPRYGLKEGLANTYRWAIENRIFN